jgi:hypothetical protein
VTIDRDGGKVETLRLMQAPDNPLVFESAIAPEEPHEFSAQVRLKAEDRTDILSFKMVEPAGHHH